MSAREDGVRANFHINLFKSCLEKNTIDLRVPASGADQYLNADDIFGHDEFYFLVEFKSWKHSLKLEDRKPAACELCRRLILDEAARKLHDLAHFAAWGHRPDGTGIPIKMGVYRHMVCNKATLSSCDAVRETQSALGDASDTEFIEKLNLREVGLTQDDFLEYIRWLLSSNQKMSVSNDFPLELYGVSFVGAQEDVKNTGATITLSKHTFKTYDSFKDWANKVTQLTKVRKLRL